ncbi:MAG: alanine racemase [Clostridia bacterium]|nr:alanine racemase [Clostridia bacterium]
MPTVTLFGAALRRNYRTLAARAGGTLIPVLKADAYGHGALFAARTLVGEGAALFAVATASEAKELLNCKELFTNPQVFIFGAVEKEALLSLCTARVILSVHSFAYAKTLSSALSSYKEKGLLRADFRLAVHAKLETGMYRLGMSEREWRAARALPHLFFTGAYSHLGSPDRFWRTAGQALRFHTALAHAHGVPFSHLAASGALLRYGTLGCDGARAGLALYGVPPRGTEGVPLSPVMRFEGRVLAVRDVPKGARVGYGGVRARQRMRLAILDAGYADGVPTGAAAGGFLTVRGRRCPVFGQVCMDRTAIEIGTLPLREGDALPFFGVRAGDTAAFAAACGTSPYPLLCQRSARTERVFL